MGYFSTFSFFLVFLFSCFFSFSAVGTSLIDKKSTDNGLFDIAALRQRVANNLQQAGNNRAAIERALTRVDKEKSLGMLFLVAYMPRRDLRTLSTKFLLENLELAYQARMTSTWAQQIPLVLFYNDVLPYAILDERRDNWRRDFLQRFLPKVKLAKTVEQAVILIAQAIQKELKVKYSTKRNKANQSPYESMETGLASCTGLSILLCNALRSVGIPARIVGVPSWKNKRGNHNWVEFWGSKEKKWHFIEYYLDAKGFDQAWFVDDAARADAKNWRYAIYASSWHSTGRHFPLVWNLKNTTVSAKNVTQYYVAKQQNNQKITCQLRVEFRNKSDARVAIPIVIILDKKVVFRGDTPQPTRDDNDYLAISLAQNKSYLLRYQLPAAKGQRQWRERVVAIKKQPYLIVRLKGDDVKN